MSELHYIGADVLEQVDPKFVREGLLSAQKKTWEVLHQIRAELNIGMGEDEARKLALRIFADHGVAKHWHRPYIRFGEGTTLTFNDPLQPDLFLKDGDPYYLDLGPIWTDPTSGLSYEGDVGDTFIFGENVSAEECAATARKLFSDAKLKWQSGQLTGAQIYAYLRKNADELGYRLLEEVAGHRVGDFPHQKYSKERLSKLPFCPKTSLWILEVQIVHPSMKFGAFYEDLLV